jgi:hypothetical protein
VVKKYLMAREKARESVRFVIVFISFLLARMDSLETLTLRSQNLVATRKTIDCWLRLRARWTAEGQARSLEEPLDFRTKALGRAICRQLKRLVTVLLLLVIKPHQFPIESARSTKDPLFLDIGEVRE